MQPNLEALFQLWRKDQDSDALAQILEAAEKELLPIARKQARDESSAHDLLQDTFLTAIHQAHRFDATQRVMPWLVGLLLVNARRGRRNEQRVPDPHRIEERPPELPDREAAGSEVRDEVARALGTVPDLYGQVLRLHLFDGLTHGEIGARLGRTPGTVRVQVFRGLAHLRKALPASLSLGAAFALLAPRSEAAWSARVLDEAARALPVPAPELEPASDTASAPGDLAPAAPAGGALAIAGVARWLGAAAAVLAIGGAAWWVLTPERAQPERAPVVALTAPDPGAGAPPSATIAPPEQGVERASLPQAAAGVAPSALAPGVWLVAEVLGLDALPPQPALDLVLRPEDNAQPPRAAQVAPGARFELDLTAWYAPGGSAPRQFIAVLDHAHALPAQALAWLADERLGAARGAAMPEASARVEIPVRFELARAAARVRGRVTGDPRGSWADGDARARVGLFAWRADGQPESAPVEAIATGIGETFVLRARAPGSFLLAAAAPGLRVANLPIDLAASEERDAGTIALEPGLAIEGIVFGPDSAPASRARVSWRAAEPGRSCSMHGVALTWIGGRLEPTSGACSADGSGAFRVEGLAPADHVLWPEIASRSGRVPIALDDIGHISGQRALEGSEARVAAGTRGVGLRIGTIEIELAVTGAGAPLDAARVERLSDGGGHVVGRTDAQGRATLLTSGRPGTVRVRVSKLGYEPGLLAFDTARLAPGAGLAIDLAPGATPVELSFDAGAIDLSGCTLLMAPAAEIDEDTARRARELGQLPQAPGFEMLPLDSEGRLPHRVPPGRWIAQIRPGADARGSVLRYARATDLELDLAPGAVVRQRVEIRLGGRLRIAPVTRPAGVQSASAVLEREDGTRIPLALTALLLRADARQGRTTTIDSIAHFGVPLESGLLDPGTYTLRIEAGGQRSVQTVVVEAGVTREVE